ncbi:MAG: NEW3 domain-containing protein [Acidimicrobiales bacterium]
MRITSVRSTYCFVAVEGRPAQVVRVALAGAPSGADATVGIVGTVGQQVRAPFTWRGRLDPARAGREEGPAWAPGNDPAATAPGRYQRRSPLPEGLVVEVPVLVGAGRRPGDVVAVRAWAEAAGSRAEAEAAVVVREPGWRMLMVPHFHYDPVWWNTQAGYTSGWDELLWAQDRRASFQHTGLTLVEAHLERARADPGYKFVLAEVDYLKPFWDLYPDRRQELQALLGAGRLEVVGGTYNEPNTNLTGAETAIRAAVYGLGFQRDVLGADPRTAWQLDVFGHDPQVPGIMADCGLGSSAWARGPFHQWGPRQETGSNAWMQFPSEFDWVAPTGRSLLTCYMPDHYSAGWELETASTLEGAMWTAYELFCDLAEVAATHVTLLPVGTDCTPPGRFVTDVAAAWSARYIWPRFEVGLPREFFAAVDAELSERGRAPSPQTRDMNPVYTGKDVSFIDVKQAQRLAETHLADAETMAALASLLGAPVPRRAIDKAWRQLVFCAHHDGITGSESDQVYLDLLGAWRESFELARQVEGGGRELLVGAIDTTGGAPGDRRVVVVNCLAQDRSEVVSLEAPAPGAGEAYLLTDTVGKELPLLSEPSGRTDAVQIRFRARSVPGIGYRSFGLGRRRGAPGGGAGWSPAPGTAIANEHLEVAADPARGGGLVSITERSSGFQLVPPGEVGNELFAYPEYSEHPRFGEGPWHLSPSGTPDRSGSSGANVRRERSPLGERLVVEGRLGYRAPRHGEGNRQGFAYRQVTTLWQGARRLELRTEIRDWSARDRLVRLRFPTGLAGATPVSAVGDAVVARGWALPHVDSAEHPWTLDNPAAEWFGLSTTLVVEAREGGRAYHERSIGVAEVVTPPGGSGRAPARQLMVSLVQKGVTATCSEAPANRYGALSGDSNLPDFRIAIGRPDDNPFVAELFERAGPAYGENWRSQLERQGWARLLVPPERPLAQVWRPGADLRDHRALPVLVVAGNGPEATEEAVADLAREVATGRATVDQPSTLVPQREKVPRWTAAIINRGTPGFAATSGGALYVSLLRACTGWPSGVWTDPPRRSAPDGSAFQLEHWDHVFELALVLGRWDWRQAGCVEEARSYNRPLRASLAEPHPGSLPATAYLLRVVPRAAKGASGAGSERAGQVVLGALKPAGNPLASSDPPPAGLAPGEANELTLRCYEAHGQAAEVEVTSHFHLSGARRANLLEEPAEWLPTADGAGQGRAVRLALGAGEITTVRLQFGPGSPAAGPPVGATEVAAGTAEVAAVAPQGGVGTSAGGAEVAQPVFSRYWLHNKGAAPMGNRSLAVHVLGTALAVRAGATGELTAQVSSGSAQTIQAGRLELVGPTGWDIEPPSRIFSLAPRAYVRVQARFRVPTGTHPGRRFLAARVADGPGQVQEDVVTVDVLPELPGAGPPSDGAAPAPFAHPSGQCPAELEASVEVTELAVPAGRSARLGLRLVNRTLGQLRGEVQLISPLETWPLAQPWSQGWALGPGEEGQLGASVRGPAQGELSSWALFKVTYYGRLWYSPAVLLRLGGALPVEDQLVARTW